MTMTTRHESWTQVCHLSDQSNSVKPETEDDLDDVHDDDDGDGDDDDIGDDDDDDDEDYVKYSHDENDDDDDVGKVK